MMTKMNDSNLWSSAKMNSCLSDTCTHCRWITLVTLWNSVNTIQLEIEFPMNSVVRSSLCMQNWIYHRQDEQLVTLYEKSLLQECNKYLLWKATVIVYYIFKLFSAIDNCSNKHHRQNSLMPLHLTAISVN